MGPQPLLQTLSKEGTLDTWAFSSLRSRALLTDSEHIPGVGHPSRARELGHLCWGLSQMLLPQHVERGRTIRVVGWGIGAPHPCPDTPASLPPKTVSSPGPGRQAGRKQYCATCEDSDSQQPWYQAVAGSMYQPV